ncbi:MAG: hypothetical protein ACOCYR_05420 [Erythrobacter sp.]|nr:MAG: hypothetical protein HLUCCO15_03360 [Erythrobacteraceae bacterium HL-111]SDS85322.1 hypothetical protein SAMN04515621_2367 [Erythrobacter sp. HL-111]
MLKIALVLFPMIATTLMGIAVIAVLTMDLQAGMQPIAIAALVAFVLSVPASWFIARQIPGVGKT